MTIASSKRQTAKANAKGDPFAGAYTFRSLAMWQRAQELTNEIFDVVASLPNDRGALVVSQQILRSASSIAANIAEGHGRFTLASYRNHLSIARGSTAETISWVDLMRRRKMITAEQEQSLLAKCAELMRMITAKMIDLEKRAKSGHSLHDEREVYEAEALDV